MGVDLARLGFWPWALVTGLATAVAVLGKTRGPRWLHLAAKPGIVPPLIVAAGLLPSSLASSTRAWLIAALALAWLGDVALMFGRLGFFIGLGSFLLAHAAYLVCFSLELPWRLSQLTYLAALLPVSLLAMRGVLGHVGRLAPLVAIYAGVLAGVVWRLLSRFDRLDQLGPVACVLGAAGGGLFMLADALLVRRRFAGVKVPYWLELGSYALAQTCIVAATVR
jgi:uncharacterized membrane protein YhhN